VPRQSRHYSRDFAIAFLGAANATDLKLAGVIDRHIVRVLDATDGNLSLAAQLLGMHRRSLQRYEKRRGRRKRAGRATSRQKRR